MFRNKEMGSCGRVSRSAFIFQSFELADSKVSGKDFKLFAQIVRKLAYVIHGVITSEKGKVCALLNIYYIIK